MNAFSEETACDWCLDKGLKIKKQALRGRNGMLKVKNGSKSRPTALNVYRSLSVASIIGAFTLTSVPAFAESANTDGVADIIVTARKVEENAQDVPISITAFSGDAFEKAGLTEFTDIAVLTPNLNIRPNGATGSTFLNITLRGQSAGFLTLNADQAVGMYVNGAPITRGSGLNNLFDVERVEVLKGPQGTLYGKNTTGGAISIVTKAPVLNEFGGYAKTTIGNFSQTDGELVVNIPLVDDKLAVRVGGLVTRRDGFGTGENVLGQPTGRELSNDKETAVRGSILFKPSSTVSLRINADYHEQDEAGPIVRSQRSVFGGFLALETTSPDFYVGNDLGASASFTKARDWNLNAALAVDLGGAQINSITSYRDQKVSLGYQASPATGVALGQESHIFAQELRLSGSAISNRLDWQVGAFYSNESGIDIDNLPGFGAFQTTSARNESWSIFTQNSFAITNALKFTGGVRYTHENRRVRDLSATPPPIAQANASFGGWTWLATLDYKIVPDVLVYVSASRGFRSGSIDQDRLSTIVQPEILLNYEAGIKADFLDRKVRFNLTGFCSKYDNIQITSFDPNNFPATILRNAAKADLKGFELETTIAPIAGLTLSGTLGHISGQYKNFIDGPLDRSDEPIGGPAWQYSLTGRYETQISGKTKFGMQLNYFHIASTRLTTPTVEAALPATQRRLNPIGLLNGQIDFDFDFFKGLNVALFGTNILDKKYFSGGIIVPIIPAAGQIVSNRFAGDPATYGIRLTKAF